MQLLIAHGDRAARLALSRVADDAGRFEVIECGDGVEALNLLLAACPPAVAVVDWSLLGVDGLELCRLAQVYREAGPPYVILLAGEGREVAEGLDAGANDCVRIPVNPVELRARIDVGRRFAALPWERMARARTADDDEGDAKITLSALHALNGEAYEEELDAAPEETFELESVLVPE